MSDIQLSPHFRLSEFLRSNTVPQIKEYQPSPSELEALQSLARYLEQVRDRYGPIRITGGLRPASLRVLYYIGKDGKRVETPEGISMTEALQRAGYGAADQSDHILGLGCDFKLVQYDDPQTYTVVYKWMQSLPGTRQVILYFRRGKENVAPEHIHAAVTDASHPAKAGTQFAWVNLDDKRMGDIA